jgi:hypothetical protein
MLDKHGEPKVSEACAALLVYEDIALVQNDIEHNGIGANITHTTQISMYNAD